MNANAKTLGLLVLVSIFGYGCSGYGSKWDLFGESSLLGTQNWRHATKGPTEFVEEQQRCRKVADDRFPYRKAEGVCATVYGPANQRRVECATVDGNATARVEYYQSCMANLGWTATYSFGR